MARRIAITVGNGSDYVAAVDTDADDASGNTITAQVFALINEKGEISDFPDMYEKLSARVSEIQDTLLAMLEVLQNLKEK